MIHENLDLDVCRGEILGVVGGSGTGKSVLMRSIIGLQVPDEGMISVFGHNMLGEDESDVQEEGTEAQDVRKRWGVLFQGGALFSTLTVAENVQVPLREFYPDFTQRLLDELARYKINLVGLPSESANKYPSELSGGMKKRAGLARALAMDPDLLFLDEPTAGPRSDRRGQVRRADAQPAGDAGLYRVPHYPRSRHAPRDLRPGGGAGGQAGDRHRYDR